MATSTTSRTQGIKRNYDYFTCHANILLKLMISNCRYEQSLDTQRTHRQRVSHLLRESLPNGKIKAPRNLTLTHRNFRGCTISSIVVFRGYT